MALLEKLRELYTRYDRLVLSGRESTKDWESRTRLMNETYFRLDVETREALGQAIDVFERLQPATKDFVPNSVCGND